jgi:hypothetical protein
VFLAYRLPYTFDELVVVTHRFHLKPLLSLLSGDGHFYVLALSQNQVRLLSCTRHSVAVVELPTLPSSLAEALKYNDPHRQLQFHTGTPAALGRRAAMFHGQGVGIDDTKDNLLEYFRQIDRGLHEALRDEDAPLVLAAVDYYFPLYKEVTDYPHVVDSGIAGNPEALRPEALQAQAWPLVEPIFQQAYTAAVGAYQRYAGTGRTARALAAIVPAAYHGRVDTLFVALGVQEWGTFNPPAQEVRLSPHPEPAHADLLDLAAIHTFLNRGTVYAVAPEQVPDQTTAAAVLRY